MAKTLPQTIGPVAGGPEWDEPEIDYSEYEILEPARDGMPPVYGVSPEQGRRLFDEAVRREVGISGEEFIRRWQAGEFATIPDDEEHRSIIELTILIPFALQDA
ncbi:MAG: hypothetical protein ACR2LS_02215 [Thermomicrobiales bacterium]